MPFSLAYQLAITRLQYIQNPAAKILTHTKHSAHNTSILFELHWLQVSYRIKKLLLTFQSLHDLHAPRYLWNLKSPTLRPDNFGLLNVAFSLSLGIASLLG